MTVRRDLEALELEGVLRRVHGGAIDLAMRGYAAPYSVRAKQAADAKAAIGRAAAAMLGERETVVLDVGTTTLQVARALHDRRNLTVLTPSLHIANALARYRGIRLMLTGGQVTAGEGSLVGDMAEGAFSRLRFDTFVMGIGGVDLGVGVHGVQPRGRPGQARGARVRAPLHRRRRQQQAGQGHLRADLRSREGRRPGDRQRCGSRGPGRAGG